MTASRLLLVVAAVLAVMSGCQSMCSRCSVVCEPCLAPQCGGGIYPTVVIPWCCDGCGVDEQALAAQIDYQLKGCVHGLLVLGTIGEGEYANMAQREQVIRTAVAVSKGCVPVVAGIHTCNLEVAKEQMLQAKALGAKGVLVKYVGNPCALFPEVHAFFHELAALNCLPIFYYHYPSQTGLKLTPGEIAEILMIPGVVGIKESTLDLKEVEQHILLTACHGKIFFSGTALNLTQFMQLGGHGAMCPEAVLLPAKTVRAYDAFVAGRLDEARCHQEHLFALTPVLRGGFASENFARCVVMCAQDHKIKLSMGNSHPQARIKAALNYACIPTSPLVKCPLPQLSRSDQRAVQDAMETILDRNGKPLAPAPEPYAMPLVFQPHKWGCVLPKAGEPPITNEKPQVLP